MTMRDPKAALRAEFEFAATDLKYKGAEYAKFMAEVDKAITEGQVTQMRLTVRTLMEQKRGKNLSTTKARISQRRVEEPVREVPRARTHEVLPAKEEKAQATPAKTKLRTPVPVVKTARITADSLLNALRIQLCNELKATRCTEHDATNFAERLEATSDINKISSIAISTFSAKMSFEQASKQYSKTALIARIQSSKLAEHIDSDYGLNALLRHNTHAVHLAKPKTTTPRIRELSSYKDETLSEGSTSPSPREDTISPREDIGSPDHLRKKL